MTRRILRGLAAAALLVALSAGAASAGGWATIQADTGNPPQPNAGEPFTFGFTVLQHGVTPAGWVETPDIPRDQRRDRRAGRGQGRRPGRRRPLRRDGDAPVGRLLDVAGRADGPHRRDRAAADGRRAGRRRRCRRWTRARCSRRSSASGPRSGRSTRRSSSPRPTRCGRRSRRSSARSGTSRASARRSRSRSTASTAQPAAADRRRPRSPCPLFAVVGIAVLAGAISGFAMTMLGRGTRPKSGGSPDGSRGGAGSRRRRPHDALTLSRARATSDRGSRQRGPRSCSAIRSLACAAASSAAIAVGVSCSWRSRPKRAARSASGTTSSQRRRSASPSW